MSEISIKTHNVIFDDQENLIMNEAGEVLIHCLKNNTVVYVPQEKVSDVFGLSFQPVNTDPDTDMDFQPLNTYPETDTAIEKNRVGSEIENEGNLEENLQNEQVRMSWTKNETLKLINAYKDNENLFKSTTVRNEKIWKIICEKLGKKYTAEQCKNKFKYLKSKYTKKKDNMSSKASGEKKIDFEYFEEMEEIFGNDPNITPIAIAGSRKPGKILLEENGESLDDSYGEKSGQEKTKEKQECEKPSEKQKLTPSKHTKISEQLEKIREDLKEKEINRERRHKELLEQREKERRDFNTYLQFLMKNQ